MDPRTMRVRIAARAAPSVTAGRIRWLAPPRPDTGNQPISTEKIKIKTGPRAKLGTERPSKVKNDVARSPRLPRRHAEKTPAGGAIAIQTINAARDNSRVAGKRFRTIARTGAPKRIERPQSPRASPSRYRAYWT